MKGARTKIKPRTCKASRYAAALFGLAGLEERGDEVPEDARRDDEGEHLRPQHGLLHLGVVHEFFVGHANRSHECGTSV
ncbi:MAG: hypothetical protein HY457_03630 [Parcubacteria group bacterium]|nr:hypothetical protein [Parcubacteria group bacterium]